MDSFRSLRWLPLHQVASMTLGSQWASMNPGPQLTLASAGSMAPGIIHSTRLTGIEPLAPPSPHSEACWLYWSQETPRPKAALAAPGSQKTPANPGPNSPWHLPALVTQVSPLAPAGFLSSRLSMSLSEPRYLSAQATLVVQLSQVATTAPKRFLDSRVLEDLNEHRPPSYHSIFWLPLLQVAPVAPQSQWALTNPDS